MTASSIPSPARSTATATRSPTRKPLVRSSGVVICSSWSGMRSVAFITRE